MLPFYFRSNTCDERVWRSVVLRNEYFLPERFTAHTTIIDVGAHIGSFAFAAAERGAGCVFAFEPDRSNHALAILNTRRYATIVNVTCAAVWRSDIAFDQLHFGGYEIRENLVNTGGGHVFAAGGQAIGAIAFDEIVDQATAGGTRRVRLVKLDCEGSEFPILLTSQRLHLIDEIVGEYHEMGDHVALPIPPMAGLPGYSRYAIADLESRLRQFGFDVRTGHRYGRRYGLFIARRERTACDDDR